MRVLLVSSYELGHQPFHLASAAAVLRAAGHAVQTLDLSREPLGDSSVEWSDGVAFAVPMHTALRIALPVARSVRSSRPEVSLCFFGLYARAADLPAGATAIAGEYEPGLVRWAAGLGGLHTSLARSALDLAPDRSGLGGLESYVGLELGGERRTVGSTTATRGCRYRCRHCPVPAVYGGRMRAVDRDLVVGDIGAQVAAGAQHISFADPDFLNGPRHTIRILEEAHRRHPSLTFDATIKVEHLLRYRDLIPRMAELGVIFVVSAFETTNDRILDILDKGHTSADMVEAVHLVRAGTVDLRPTWLPFTPWTEMTDLVDMLRFMEKHELEVDPIQLTIRLLVPRGSLLLDLPTTLFSPGPFDSEALSFTWQAADPEIDDLQRLLTGHVESMQDRPPDVVLEALTGEILSAAGVGHESVRLSTGERGPRLTEPWFC